MLNILKEIKPNLIFKIIAIGLIAFSLNLLGNILFNNPNKDVNANDPNLSVSVFMSDLDIAWDVAFTPDQTMLVNQRSGGIKARLSNGTIKDVEADFSDLYARGEGGLMGMVVDPNFNNNRRFYTCQGHRDPLEIQVISWTINADYSQATRVNNPLVSGIPINQTGRHSGCRLRFGADNYLYISTGDIARGSTAQDLTSLAGKVLRVDSQTGLGIKSNPFFDSESANSKLIYSYGHRNPQGLALRPNSSQMWAVEHGPLVDDEINLLQSGANYGWDPVEPNSNGITYNENVPMTDTSKYPNAIEAKWSSGSSTYATAGGIFLEGSNWGDKEGLLAVATLKNSTLYLFNFNDAGQFQSMVIPAELERTYNRLRSVIIGPDQALYITYSQGVLRVAPQSQPKPEIQPTEPTTPAQTDSINPIEPAPRQSKSDSSQNSLGLIIASVLLTITIIGGIGYIIVNKRKSKSD